MRSRKEQLNNNLFLELHNLSIFYDFKFDPIKAYLQHTQNLIQGIELGVKDKINKWDRSKGSNKEIPDGFDIYEHEVITTGEFRSILSNSIFLTTYGLFENEFKRICVYSAEIQKSLLRPKDLHGYNYIDQCRRFITKVLDVNLEKLNTEWDEISKFQTLRNSFAHNDGILKDKSEKNIEFIKRTKGLSLDEVTYKINIEDNEFLIYLIEKLVKFLNLIINEIVMHKSL